MAIANVEDNKIKLKNGKGKGVVEAVKEGTGNALYGMLGNSPKYQMDLKGLADQIREAEQESFFMAQDITIAKTEIPEIALPYVRIMNAFGFEVSDRIANLFGFETGTLTFYKSHARTNSLKLIMNGKAQKVIDSSTGYVEKLDIEERTDTTEEDSEHNEETSDIVPTPIKARSLLQLLQKKMGLYGRAMANVNAVGETPNDLRFDVIEPFRYGFREENSTWYIFTYIGIKKVAGTSREIYNVIERQEKEIHETETTITVQYIERIYDCYIDSREEGTVIVATSKIIEREIDGYMLNEFVNDVVGSSDIEEIKHELLAYDLAETMFNREIISTGLTIHADGRYFEDNRLISSGAYKIYSDVDTEGGTVEKPLFEVNQPLIRVQDYVDTKIHYLDIICIDMGMSARALGFTNVNDQTATEALLDDEKTIETINASKADFKEQFGRMIDELYIKQNGEAEYVFVLEDYKPQSMSFKSKIVQSIGDNASIEYKVKMLNPTFTETDVLRETVLIKLEKTIPFTKKEMEYARKEGLIEDPLDSLMSE